MPSVTTSSTEADPPLSRLVLELSVASEHLRASWRQELGVSAYEMLAITHLDSAGRLTIGQLGSRLALSSGAMTGLVDRLEGTGRVARIRDERDRRRVYLTVTDETRADLERLTAPLRERVEALGEEPAPPADVLGRLVDCYVRTLEERS